jgi:hypothetical protein
VHTHVQSHARTHTSTTRTVFLVVNEVVGDSERIDSAVGRRACANMTHVALNAKTSLCAHNNTPAATAFSISCSLTLVCPSAYVHMHCHVYFQSKDNDTHGAQLADDVVIDRHHAAPCDVAWCAREIAG